MGGEGGGVGWVCGCLFGTGEGEGEGEGEGGGTGEEVWRKHPGPGNNSIPSYSFLTPSIEADI